MKRNWLALTLAFALLLTGCSSAANPSTAGPGGNSAPSLAAKPSYPKSLDFDDYEAKHAVREEYPVADEIWDSVAEFSARSASLALGDTDENSLYSPISLWFALAICAESAEGETRDALLEALGLSGDAASTAKAMYNRLYTDNEMGALKLSNSLWVNETFTVNQDFLKQAAKDFYAHSYTCDFSSPKTGQAMGDWLDKATGGLLGGEPLETDEATLMTLFSAIYYSDQWTDEFNEENNTTGDFRNGDGTVSQAEYMNRTYGSHGWQVGDGWISSSLGLKNGGGMTFVLPDEGVTPGELLADPDTLAAILSRENDGGFGEVVFQVPKFEVSDSLDLRDTVTGLGAGVVFDPEKADFSNLSDQVLCLSDVKQEATLSIDEKGVTAAAYTQILYCGAAMPEGRAELILDRPFLFFVSFCGVPLFIGVVNQM